MKKLVFAIPAIAALAIAAYFILAPRPPAAVASLPAAEPVSSPTPSSTSPTPSSDQSLQLGALQPQDTTPHREPERHRDTQKVLPGSQTRAAQPAPPKDEGPQMAACRELWDSRRKREQAAHDAEAKDPAWAYAMEQKLREYASQRLRGTSIELEQVDCKTTFCDLLMEAFDPDSANEINNAMEDAKKQPWSDFTGTSFAKTSEEGNTYRVELARMRSYRTPFENADSEQDLACMRLISDRNLRERAARDAQPKDPSWAEPMEQMLHQYLTTQLGKHVPERIEVDCRTTYCRIAAEGRTNDSSMAFQKIAQAAAAEPWADMRNGEGGASGQGDDWKQEYFLYRR